MYKLAIALIGLSALFMANEAVNHNKIVSCYYSSWAFYRWGHGKFDVDDIDPNQCTHGFYGFADLDNQTWTVYAFDPWFDLAPEDCEPGYCNYNSYRRFVGLKERNPNFKAMLSIGGWNAGSGKYSLMAKDPAKRATFIASVVDFLNLYGFDGVDLDWEYPGTRVGADPIVDKETFNTLVDEFSKALKPQGLLFTTAMGCGYQKLLIAYDVPYLAERFDFMNMMAYDYNGAWNNFTGHNSPMYPRDEENFESSITYKYNLWDTMQLYEDLGAPKEKMVIGIPVYGRGFHLLDNAYHDLFCPADGPFPKGPYSRLKGTFNYLEVQQLFYNDTYSEQFPDAVPGQWEVVVDDCYNAPYTYNGPYWLGYDDEESVRKKARYINGEGYAGAMVWSIEADDFEGIYPPNKPYHLLSAINEELENGQTFDPANPSCGSAPICDGFIFTTAATTTSTAPTTTTSAIITTSDGGDGTTTTPGDVNCASQPDGVKFPVPGNCKQYFMCMSSEPMIFNCNNCEYYNTDKTSCDQWTEEGSGTRCSNGEDFNGCNNP